MSPRLDSPFELSSFGEAGVESELRVIPRPFDYWMHGLHHNEISRSFETSENEPNLHSR